MAKGLRCSCFVTGADDECKYEVRGVSSTTEIEDCGVQGQLIKKLSHTISLMYIEEERV